MSSPRVPVSGRVQKEPVACPQCGSGSRVKRGLCLSCLLSQGLPEETPTEITHNGGGHDAETLEDVLSEIEVRDADWKLGNYQILEEIGRGGMGVIYRARQRHSRRIVALKRILAYHADSQETLERFRREAEAAAHLDHPNILPIYEVGQGEDELPFFSMKFAGGGSLVEAAPTLPGEPRRAAALMAKVARAVQHAHTRGILHRDLKPANILLDGHGEPLVSDFGLATWLDSVSDLTHSLTIFGTPGYIAPEQANPALSKAAKLSPAADVYSLGAILFDLLTGRPPFLGEHALAVIHQASQNPAPKLRSLVPPAQLWRLSRRNPVIAGMAALLLALGSVLGVVIWKGGTGSPTAAGGIAVLPFESLVPDKTNAFFADGIYDGVSTKLAKIADLKVISHNSVAKYRGMHDAREVGRALNVAYVFQGSVRREAGRIHF